MAKIRLTIVGNNEDALKKVNIVKEALTELSKQPVKITFAADGLNDIVSKLKNATEQEIKAAEAAAKLANAEARKISAQTKATEAARKLGTQAKETAQAEAEAATVTEKTASAANNAARAQADFSNSLTVTIKQIEPLVSKITQLANAYNTLSRATLGSNGQKVIGSGSSAAPYSTWQWDDGYITVSDYTVSDEDVGGTSSTNPFAQTSASAQKAAASVSELNNSTEKAWQKFNDLRDITSSLNGSLSKTNENIKEQSYLSKILGNDIGTVVVKMAAWQVTGNVVASLIRAFKDAVATMKEVDTELTTIQKVTNKTNEEIKALADNAYDAASSYGIAVKDYLSSVSAFARAGYGDAAEAAADLATKTQLVGDTTDETANKFLIAIDAAYKYGHNIEELSKVLDMANTTENTQAVSLAQIAEAMPKVASTASMAGVQVDELIASIGTIIATTQTTASTAGTALRALIANVLNDTMSAVDGEVAQTEDQVKSFDEVLQKYASDALEAARNTGELINPMEALSALAQAYKEGALSDADLYAIEYSLSGKLRVNQLEALLSSWNTTYAQIMSDIADSAGSADKEVSVMLTSWEAKTNILANTWNGFIASFINTDFIKGTLDVVTSFVRGLDTGIGQVTIGVTGLSVAWVILDNVIKSSNPVLLAVSLALAGITTAVGIAAQTQERYNEHIRETYPELSKLKDEIEELTKGYQTANDRIAQTERETETAAQVAAHYAERLDELKTVIEDENTTQEEAAEAKLRYKAVVETLNDLIPTLNLKIDEQTGLLSSEAGAIDELTAAWKRNAIQQAYQEQYTELYKRQAEVERDRISAAEEYELKLERQNFLQNEANNLLSKMDALRDENGVITDTSAYSEYANSLNAVTSELSELDEQLPQYEQATADADAASKRITEDIANLDIRLDNLRYRAETTKQSFDTLTEAEEAEGESAKSLAEVYNELKEQVEPLGKALKELNEKGVITSSTFDKLIEQYPELADGAEATAEGWVLSKEALEAQLTALKANYQTVYDNAVNAASEILNSENAKQQSIDRTTQSIYDQIQALGRLYGLKMEEARENALERYGNDAIGRRMAASDAEVKKWEALYYEAANAGINLRTAESNLRNANTAITGLTSGGSSSKGSSGSSPSSSAKDEELERLKEIVKLRESELSFLKASGASEDEQISKVKEIQEALHLQADYMRSIGADQADINALSTKWWSLQKDIADIQEKMAKTLREQIAAALEDIGSALVKQKENMLDPLNDELEALKNAHEAAKDRREEEEKILAVEEARIALENAQKERNVRVYNANTEQWEWQANSKTVEEAQKKFADAQTELAEYYADAEYEAAKDNLEKQIEYTDSAFDSFKKAWDEATKAIKDGKMSYEEAYAYIKAQMQEIYDKYGIDLSGVLEEASNDLYEQFGDLGIVLLEAKERLSKLFEGLDVDIDSVNEALDRILTSFAEAGGNLNDIVEIFENVPSKYREALLTAIDSIFADRSITDEAKKNIIDDIHAIFSNEKLTSETKGKIVEAIEKLLGSSDKAETAVDLFRRYIENALKAADPKAAIQSLSDAIRNGVITDLNDVSQILRALNGNYESINSETAKIWALTKMQANSIAWHSATDDERERLANENLVLGTAMGWTRKSDGFWYDRSGNKAYNVFEPDSPLSSEIFGGSAQTSSGASQQGNSADFSGTNNIISQMQKNSAAWAGASDAEKERLANENLILGVSQGWTRKDDGHWYDASGRQVYDNGGILHGVGGIKATEQDEMILPPDMTKAVVDAERRGDFEQFISHLGIVTSAANALRLMPQPANVNRYGIGTQNNSNDIIFNGMELKTITEGTTIKELAQMAKSLALL